MFARMRLRAIAGFVPLLVLATTGPALAADAPTVAPVTVAAPVPPADETRRPRVQLELEDDDPAALVELRDERGTVLRCIGRCELSAPLGRYHMRVAHGSSVDETDLTVESDARLRSRESTYGKLAIGAPLIVVGTITAATGALVASWVAATYDRGSPERRNNQIGGGVALALGLAGVVGGIVLVSNAHGSLVRFETSERRAGKIAARLSVVPTTNGAGLSLTGSF